MNIKIEIPKPKHLFFKTSWLKNEKYIPVKINPMDIKREKRVMYFILINFLLQ